jgi:hypothetical protein
LSRTASLTEVSDDDVYRSFVDDDFDLVTTANVTQAHFISMDYAIGNTVAKLPARKDSTARGPFLVWAPSHPQAECHFNDQPFGSAVYQLFRDFHGVKYSMQMGVQHQGYGDEEYRGKFGRGSGAIGLPRARNFNPARACTPGYFMDNVWYEGTCEADVICNYAGTTGVDRGIKSQAQQCPEGHICGEATNSLESTATQCKPGFVCYFGTTPDANLDSPRGEFKRLCPSGFYCPAGTGASGENRNPCPPDMFCPTGTGDPYTGRMALDSLYRGLSMKESDPFYSADGEGQCTHLPEDRLARYVARVDQACFEGIDEKLRLTWLSSPRSSTTQDYPTQVKATSNGELVNANIPKLEKCGRDHAWRLVRDAMERMECDCTRQARTILAVYELWRCTHSDSLNTKYCADDFTLTGKLQWTEHVTVSNFTALEGRVMQLYAVQYADRVAGRLERIDPYLFDLKWAIEFTLEWRHAVESLIALAEPSELSYGFKYSTMINRSSEVIDAQVPTTYTSFPGRNDTYGSPLDELLAKRLDACRCQQLLQCPNGTSAPSGSTSIYDCAKSTSVDEVFLRVVPIPVSSQWLEEVTDNASIGTAVYTGLNDVTKIAGKKSQELSDGLPALRLGPWQTAIVTFDLRKFAVNLTYDEHYRIGI